MQFTIFSFVMSLLWFNLYIIIINTFRKNDNFIISFSTFPLVFFLFLSIFRLIFNFEIPGSVIIRSRSIFPHIYDLIRKPLYLKDFGISILQLFIFTWITVALTLIVSNALKYKSFREILDKLKKSQNIENQQFFNKILKQTKMIDKIEIIQNDKVSSPFIVGVIKGKIYIPDIPFSQEELEYIISHEINHFLRKDSLKKILIQGIKYIFWWNPFAHLFANNFNHILEIQCDLKTTADFSNEGKIRYLESITKIIKDSTSNSIKYSTVPNFINIDDMDSLKQRFRIVLNYKEKRSWFNIFNVGLCALALCLYIGSYFIILQPYYNPATDEVEDKEGISDSFIIENSNGDYDIYINNIFNYSIKNLDELDSNLNDLPIYKEEED